MTYTEQVEFESLFSAFIKDHNLTNKEIDQFQEDTEEILNNVCESMKEEE